MQSEYYVCELARQVMILFIQLFQHKIKVGLQTITGKEKHFEIIRLDMYNIKKKRNLSFKIM